MSRNRQVQGSRLSKVYRAPCHSLAKRSGKTHCMAPGHAPSVVSTPPARLEAQIRRKTVLVTCSSTPPSPDSRQNGLPRVLPVTAPCIRGRFWGLRCPKGHRTRHYGAFLPGAAFLRTENGSQVIDNQRNTESNLFRMAQKTLRNALTISEFRATRCRKQFGGRQEIVQDRGEIAVFCLYLWVKRP